MNGYAGWPPRSRVCVACNANFTATSPMQPRCPTCQEQRNEVMRERANDRQREKRRKRKEKPVNNATPAAKTCPKSLGQPTRGEQIGRMLAEGGIANKEIACRLGLTEGTIKNYLQTLRRKHGLQNRVDVALYFARNDRPSIPGA